MPGAFPAADRVGFPSADVPGGFDRSCLISQQVGKKPGAWWCDQNNVIGCDRNVVIVQ